MFCDKCKTYFGDGINAQMNYFYHTCKEDKK
jgi:hypothetical protein